MREKGTFQSVVLYFVAPAPTHKIKVDINVYILITLEMLEITPTGEGHKEKALGL